MVTIKNSVCDFLKWGKNDSQGNKKFFIKKWYSVDLELELLGWKYKFNPLFLLNKEKAHNTEVI